MADPLDVIRELKHATPTMEAVFTLGSCYKLYKILKVIYPDAIGYYSDKEGHWITFIKDKFYDINGQIHPEFVKDMDYRQQDDIVHQSADVAYYDGPGVYYNKYKKSV